MAWSGSCIAAFYCTGCTNAWSRFKPSRPDKADVNPPLSVVPPPSKKEPIPFCIIFCVIYPMIALITELDTDCYAPVLCENIAAIISRLISVTHSSRRDYYLTIVECDLLVM